MPDQVARSIYEAWARAEGCGVSWVELCSRNEVDGYPNAKKWHAMAFAEARAAVEAMRDSVTVQKAVPGGIAIEDAMFGNQKIVFEAAQDCFVAICNSALLTS